jgi:hypothetical protein
MLCGRCGSKMYLFAPAYPGVPAIYNCQCGGRDNFVSTDSPSLNAAERAEALAESAASKAQSAANAAAWKS